MQKSLVLCQVIKTTWKEPLALTDLFENEQWLVNMLIAFL